MSNDAVIYARVSTDEQAMSGLGIEAQLATCRAYCSRVDYNVVGEYIDRAVSGRDDPRTRPQLGKLLKLDLSDTRVVVYSVSRLTRRQSQLWRLLAEDGLYKLRLVSATENFDLGTPMGRAMIGMLGVWAQLEADMTSERTKVALAARRARGHRLGAPPMIEVNPEIVAKIAELHDEGKSYDCIAFEMNMLGIAGVRGGKWWPSAICRALRQHREQRQLQSERGGFERTPRAPVERALDADEEAGVRGKLL
jgi:DNA invertase Pin-like site-specific DNA recombinase